MKNIFVINPVAGERKWKKVASSIKRIMKEKNEEFIIELTGYPNHAIKIASRYAKKGDVKIYAVGGDGTLNEVLNGIAKTSSILGVIPCGSGNDFVKSLYDESDIYSVLNKQLYGEEKSIDIGKCNDRFFINIASCGFDAEVVANAMKFKKIRMIPNRLAYLCSVFYTIFRNKNYSVIIEIDGVKIETRVLMISVANGKFYGGGMLAAPKAKVDDGEFDICIIKPASRLRVLRFLSLFIKGKHENLPEVQFLRGKDVNIKCEDEMVFNADGEIWKHSMCKFELIKDGVKFIV